MDNNFVVSRDADKRRVVIAAQHASFVARSQKLDAGHELIMRFFKAVQPLQAVRYVNVHAAVLRTNA